LIDKVKTDWTRQRNDLNDAVPAHLQVLIALRYYAKGGFLYEVYADELNYPANVDDIKTGFHAIAGMPNVVGCILTVH
jgi:hypothetical protein